MYLKAKYKYLWDDQSFHPTCAGNTSFNASKLKLNKFFKKSPPPGTGRDTFPLLKMLVELLKCLITITEMSWRYTFMVNSDFPQVVQ